MFLLVTPCYTITHALLILHRPQYVAQAAASAGAPRSLETYLLEATVTTGLVDGS